MTQYKVALWMDSDTLVMKSLQPLLDLSERLPMPGSREKGPRYFLHLLVEITFTKTFIGKNWCDLEYNLVGGIFEEL